MAAIDYLVVTWTLPEAERDVIYQRLITITGNRNGKRATLYGARGYKSSEGFVGQWDDGKIIVASTGAKADVTANVTLNSLPVTGRSIARLDLQSTLVADDADNLILSAQPSKRYKATKYVNVNERGATMYVGSPHSDARLRIYNKTAESGILSDDKREYIRYEIQLRNRYAEQAWNEYKANRANEYILHWTRKMCADGVTDKFLEQALRIYGDRYDYRFLIDEGNWLDRRKLWIERTVVPALLRVLAVDPDYKNVLYSLIEGSGQNNCSQHE